MLKAFWVVSTRWLTPPAGQGPQVSLLASGVGVPWVLQAREMLLEHWGVRANVYSVTSWNQLRRNALEVDEHNFLHPEQPAQVPFLSQKLAGAYRFRSLPLATTTTWCPTRSASGSPVTTTFWVLTVLVSPTLALLPVVSSRSTPPVWSPRPWRLWLSRGRLTAP